MDKPSDSDNSNSNILMDEIPEDIALNNLFDNEDTDEIANEIYDNDLHNIDLPPIPEAPETSSSFNIFNPPTFIPMNTPPSDTHQEISLNPDNKPADTPVFTFGASNSANTSESVFGDNKPSSNSAGLPVFGANKPSSNSASIFGANKPVGKPVFDANTSANKPSRKFQRQNANATNTTFKPAKTRKNTPATFPSLGQPSTQFGDQSAVSESQKEDSQNISSINNMNHLSNSLNESPACPNGKCDVSRKITRPFFSFSRNNNNQSQRSPFNLDNTTFGASQGAQQGALQGAQQGASQGAQQGASQGAQQQQGQLPPPPPFNAGQQGASQGQLPPPPPFNAGQQGAQQGASQGAQQQNNSSPIKLADNPNLPASSEQGQLPPPPPFNAGQQGASQGAQQGQLPQFNAQQGAQQGQLPQFNAGRNLFGMNRFPSLPTANTQHHPTGATQFNQYARSNPFQFPVNQPSGQNNRPPLPQFNQNTSNIGDIARPPQRSSKSKIPVLLWDGRVPITNMKSISEKNNKNILTRIEDAPYGYIEQIFSYLNRVPPSDRSIIRFVIGQDKITLAYALPRTSQVRNAWHNQLEIDPNFRSAVEAFNLEQKAKLSNMYNMSMEQIDAEINNMLAVYENINVGRLSKSSNNNRPSAAFRSWNGVLYSNQQENAYQQQQQQQQQWQQQGTPSQQQYQPSCRYYETRKDCMDSTEPIRGYRRVMRSQNPCVVDYIEIKNKNDLQDSMIGCTINNPITNDPDCTVKYNMIKTFLDENGYHLEKNSTRKSRKN